MSVSRSMLRYESRLLKRDTPVLVRMRELSAQYPRNGYRLVRLFLERTGVAMIFGIDVGPPTPSVGRMFACYGGAPVRWPAQASRGFPPDGAHRLLHLGDMLVLPLFASEALDPRVPAPHRADRRCRCDRRAEPWRRDLTLGALARTPREDRPLVVASHHGGVGTGYANPRLAATWLTMRDADVVDATASHGKAAA